ncbi:MAG: FG-GAP-like repeat-containing protein, partial [Gemmataceae bacterium]|nr:FG-GAP-like repeat-containing protein [Gemmataceae bacterium]
MPSASILGSVWNDLVTDGARAGGEPGLAAVTVFLDQNGSHIQQTLTSGSGDYSFTGLAAGTYAVRPVLPAGAALTFPGAGATTQQVQVTVDQVAGGVDFGVQAAPGVIANQPIADGSAVQQMPSIAVDPLDPNHLVAVYMDYALGRDSFAGIGAAVSHNGGASWQRTPVPLPAGYDQAAGHPVVRFNDQGHFYVSFMAATFLGPKPGLIYDPTSDSGVQRRSYGMQANNGVFVVRGDESTGDLVWGQPAAVASHTYTVGGPKVYFEAIPDLAIDTNPTSPNHGNLYVTWTRFYPAGQVPWNPSAKGATDIMLAVSRDGGQNWTTQFQTQGSVQISTIEDPAAGLLPSPVEGAGFSTLSHVSVGPEGDLYVSMFAGNRFPVFHSTDAGAHFTNPDSRGLNPFGDGTLFQGLPFGREDFPAGFPRNSQFPIPNGTLFNDKFRTQSVRAILADPARPGHVYAMEAVRIVNISGTTIDAGEINFARSEDYGVTWQKIFTVGSNPLNSNEFAANVAGRFRPALNDDDGSRLLLFDTNLNDDVISGQALPQFSIDAQGNLAVIWYDTRRDPANHSLDVYGTVSTDGGRTFSANSRITSANFDPDAGAFTDARGTKNFYLGDLIGLATANGTAYAAWTDTRQGNQDIYFGHYSLTPAPVPLGDRYESNDTPPAATNLGRVTAPRVVPRLVMVNGDSDWFRVEAGATGNLIVTATAPAAGNELQLELWSDDGSTQLASSTPVLSAGQILGQQISIQSDSGQKYLVRVTGGLVPLYSLAVQSLTADLGTSVHASADGSITSGGKAIYRIVSAFGGSLEFTLTSSSNVSGNLNLQVLSADGQTVLANGQPSGNSGPGEEETISLAVDAGQIALVQVSGATGSLGAFHLDIINLDLFQTPQNASLFFPVGGSPSGIASTDVNGDRNPDLVVSSNRLSDSVSVLLGNGDGTFQAARQFDVGPGIVPSAIREPVLADLNGDTIPDLVVSNYSSADVSILLGRGDGTFAPDRRFDATVQPDSVVVVDCNGDGALDLA